MFCYDMVSGSSGSRVSFRLDISTRPLDIL